MISTKIETLNREYNTNIEDMPDPELVNDHLSGIKPSSDKVLSSKNYT